MPVSTTSAERSFSAMNIIKSHSTTTMTTYQLLLCYTFIETWRWISNTRLQKWHLWNWKLDFCYTKWSEWFFENRLWISRHSCLFPKASAFSQEWLVWCSCRNQNFALWIKLKTNSKYLKTVFALPWIHWGHWVVPISLADFSIHFNLYATVRFTLH